MPAWLWSVDGTRVLWANPVAARLFGARNAAILAEKTIGPADLHRRQVAQLSARLSPTGATRLERLRGFGAVLGRLVTCACARLSFPDGTSGIFIAAAEPVGRPMPPNERLAHLIEGLSKPAMTFTLDGALSGANELATDFAGLLNNLTDPGLDAARLGALHDGQSVLQMDFGRVAVHRVGVGADTALVALIDAVIVPRKIITASPPVIVPNVETAPAAEPPVTHTAMEAASERAVPEAVTQSIPDSSPEPETQGTTVSADEKAIPQTSDDVMPADVFESLFEEAAADISLSTAENVTSEIPVVIEVVSVFSEQTSNIAASQDVPDETLFADAPVHERPHLVAQHDAVSTHAEIPAIETPEAERPKADAETPHEATSAAETHPDDIASATEQPTPIPRAIDNGHIAVTLAQMDGPAPQVRRHPLRFMWQMDEDSRFSLGSDEFTRLIGSRTAAAFGRLWSEIADVLGLDPEGRVAAAVATRDTWSSIVVHWPVDGSGTTLPVELSGLPVYDRARNFMGYRGFGVCRDLEGLARLAARRRDDVLYSSAPSKPIATDHDAPRPTMDEPAPVVPTPTNADLSLVGTHNASPSAEPEPPVDETPKNVLPFRPVTEPKSPALTAGESNAFDELARRLSARLEGETAPTSAAATDSFIQTDIGVPETEPPSELATEYPAAFQQPEALPPRGNSAQDVQLLDRLPVGVLVYRLDRLIYANRAFLASTGYDNLHALSEAGGLDALFVEPGVVSGNSLSEEGTPVVISTTSVHGPEKGKPADARLFTITWDGDAAHALMFSGAHHEPAQAAVTAPVITVSNDDLTHAEELSTILDTTAEGIVIFDGLGRLISCNRSAEALFGRNDSDMAALNLIDLFAPESQRGVLDYLESIKATGVASLLDHGRDTLGRVRDGGIIPLSITMGRTRPDGVRFFAIFRDLSQAKKNEGELLQARRQAEQFTNAKADVLGRISHEVRMPLNAIIGFADVMIEERFGALGNERYVEYMKDIRASGQRVMAIIDDLLDLSRIESGKMELAFVNQDLNALVEQCVAVMQPQANRERIIIRTSLAHALPAVKADARALRQIALNLIGNSIHLANAGGQVIVSTATTDFGDIVLRVRDTGPGLNDNEIAAAMAPFRTPAATDETTDGPAASLSLTKALVEANRAKFHIKTAPHSGTLIEVVFSHASAIA